MHLIFLDTSPLKVFASGTRCIPEVYPANLGYAWSTEGSKRLSPLEVCIVDPGIPCIPKNRIGKTRYENKGTSISTNNLLPLVGR
jgi:hypothetical protein